MKRSSFLKALGLLMVSPKIVAEIQPVAKAASTASLFHDLNFMIPDYIPAYLAKYGNDELWTKAWEEIGTTSINKIS